MKIQNNDPLNTTGAADPLTSTPATGTAPAAKAASAPSGKTDQLTLSADAQLLKALADAAAGDAPVRADVVDRMRALLAQGKVGDDARRLADALIDDVLNKK